MEYDVFLSYSRSDFKDAQWLAEKLEECGLRVFLDTYDLVAGQEWESKLIATLSSVKCCIVCVGEHGYGAYQQREVQFAIDQCNKRGSSFGIIPVFLPGSDTRASLGPLDRFTWIDLSGRSESKIAELAAAARGESVRDSADGTFHTTQNPYKGLSAFEECDKGLFFGREREVQELFARVQEKAFVAVVGASGSGKSSLVHAGLIPLLRKGSERNAHCCISIRPGADPYLSLAEACARTLSADSSPAALERELKELHQALRPTPNRPSGAVSRVLGKVLQTAAPSGRGVLIVDQFEELYLLVELQQLRAGFGADIHDLLAGRQGAWRVVITLRADQYEPVVRDEYFGPLVAASQFALREMSGEALKAAIVEPAKAVGLALEEGLVDRILHDMADRRHALPLIEFLLERLWADRDLRRNMLTHRAYEAIGGVQNAIAKYADQIYGALTPPDQEVAREILISLVRPGKGTPDSKRPISLASMNESERRIVAYFSEARLLVSGDGVAELAHEALVSAWTRLKDWLNTERADLLAKDRLEEDALAWKSKERESPKDADALLLPSGWRLAGAEHLMKRQPRLAQEQPAIKDFIAASRNANKKRWRLYQAAAVMSTIVVCGSVIYSIYERQNAHNSQKTLIEKTLRLAAAALDAGGYSEMDAWLSEASDKADESCESDNFPTTECTLWREEIDSLRMQAKFSTGRHNPNAEDVRVKTAENTASGEAFDLAQFIIGKLGADLEGDLDESQRIQWILTREKARSIVALTYLGRASTDPKGNESF